MRHARVREWHPRVRALSHSFPIVAGGVNDHDSSSTSATSAASVHKPSTPRGGCPLPVECAAPSPPPLACASQPHAHGLQLPFLDPGCLEKRPRVTPQKLPRTKLPGACFTPSVGCPLRVVACGSRAKPHPKRSTSPRLRPPAQTARTARPTTATSMLRLALRSPCSPNERRTNSVAPFPTSRALTKFSAQRRPAFHQRQVPPTGVPPSPPRLRAHQPRRVASRTLHRDATVPGDRLLVGSHSAPGPPLFAPYAVANDALARSLVSAALVPPLRPSAAKRALLALVLSESTLLGDDKRRQQAAVVIVVGARH